MNACSREYDIHLIVLCYPDITIQAHWYGSSQVWIILQQGNQFMSWTTLYISNIRQGSLNNQCINLGLDLLIKNQTLHLQDTEQMLWGKHCWYQFHIKVKRILYKPWCILIGQMNNSSSVFWLDDGHVVKVSSISTLS